MFLPLLWLTSVYVLHTLSYNTEHLAPHLWTSLPAFSMHMNTHTHTNACAWHTVAVVHCSFIHVEGFMFGLVQHHFSAYSLPPCHSPRVPLTTSPQLWLCNTLASFKPKVLLLWADFSLFASQADIKLLSSNWILWLLYIVMKSQYAILNMPWHSIVIKTVLSMSKNNVQWRTVSGYGRMHLLQWKKRKMFCVITIKTLNSFLHRLSPSSKSRFAF